MSDERPLTQSDIKILSAEIKIHVQECIKNHERQEMLMLEPIIDHLKRLSEDSDEMRRTIFGTESSEGLKSRLNLVEKGHKNLRAGFWSGLMLIVAKWLEPIWSRSP